jgi:hypothetical protein
MNPNNILIIFGYLITGFLFFYVLQQKKDNYHVFGVTGLLLYFIILLYKVTKQSTSDFFSNLDYILIMILMGYFITQFLIVVSPAFSITIVVVLVLIGFIGIPAISRQLETPSVKNASASGTTDKSGMLMFIGIIFILGLIIFLTAQSGLFGKNTILYTVIFVVFMLFLIIPGMAFSSKEPNSFPNYLFKFYTSPFSLFTGLAILIVILLYNAKYLYIPDLTRYQKWATIAAIIFALKYFIFSSVSFASVWTILLFFAILSAIVYLIIRPQKMNPYILDGLFIFGCAVFTACLPSSMIYIPLSLLIISSVFSLFFAIETQKLSAPLVQTLFAFAFLYVSIHIINYVENILNIQNINTKDIISTFLNQGKDGTVKTANTKAQGLFLFIYVILWMILFLLYFTSSGFDFSAKNYSIFISAIIILVFTVCIYLGIFTYPGLIQTDSATICLFTVSIGILLFSYYLTNYIAYNTTNMTVNYFLIVYLVLMSILLASYSKNVIYVILFLIIVAMPFIVLSIMFNISNSAQYYPIWAVAMLIWIFANILFWNNVSIKLTDIIQSNFLYFVVIAIVGYLFLYYLYLAVTTSGETISLRISQIVLILIFGYLLLKIFKSSTYAKNNIYIKTIFDIIDYVPCLFDYSLSKLTGLGFPSIMGQKPGQDTAAATSDTMSRLSEIITGKKTGTSIMEPLGFKYDQTSAYILWFVIFCGTIYYMYPYIQNKFYTKGTTLIGDKKVPFNPQTMIITYEELTGSVTQPIYNYGVSCEIFITPNIGNDEFNTLLNFSGNIFIEYNTYQNILAISTILSDENKTKEIIYRHTHFPLQTIVNIEINSNGGIYDIFVNKQLKKTTSKIIPHNSYENVYVGSNGSPVNGYMQNLIYYKTTLNKFQIQHVK